MHDSYPMSLIDIIHKHEMEEKLHDSTSNVVYRNDASGQHFSRGTKSTIPKLLISPDA